MPMNESNVNNNDKPIVNNFLGGKKQQSSDLNFMNKKVARLISRKLRNRKSNHLTSIDPIDINDQFSDWEIDNFLAREDPENQCPRKEVVTQVEKYDFVSKLPPCLKGKESFSGIGHDLEQNIGKNEAPVVDCVPHWSSITLVHCDNWLDWIERYYRDILLLQAQVKCFDVQNALLE
jgi:hypothetical protein